LGLVEGLLILFLLNVLNPGPIGHLHPLLFTFLLSQSFLTGLVTPLFFLLIHKGSSLFFGPHETELIERGDRS
jgi:hypothetical protein